MSRLYLIRHGKPSATWGQDADPDPGLDEAGKAQAEAAADALMALPADERPTRVVFLAAAALPRDGRSPSPTRIGVRCEIDRAVRRDPDPGRAHPGRARVPGCASAFQGRWADIKGDIDYDAWRAEPSARPLVERRRPRAVFSHFVAINAALACVDRRGAGDRPSAPTTPRSRVFEVDGGAPDADRARPRSRDQVL